MLAFAPGLPGNAARARCLVPPGDDSRPSSWERVRFILTAIVPWVALYEFTAHLHLPGRAFRFGFEDRLPVVAWTAVIYQSIYLAAAAAPWLARTRRQLRMLTLSVWISLAVVFPVYWMAPSEAPRRALEASNWIAKTLRWERDAFPPTAAFPSFHVLWIIFIARLIRPAWLGVAYAAAVTVSCITTGMHYIPDVLASLAIAPLLMEPERIWRRLRR